MMDVAGLTKALLYSVSEMKLVSPIAFPVVPTTAATVVCRWPLGSFLSLLQESSETKDIVFLLLFKLHGTLSLLGPVCAGELFVRYKSRTETNAPLQSPRTSMAQ